MATFHKSHNTKKSPDSSQISSFLPNLKQLQKSSLNSLKSSPSSIKFKVSNLRNSSLIQRPANPVLNDSEFTKKCNKLWSKFDNRVSPILKKYKFSEIIKGKLEEPLNSGKFSEKQRNYRDTCANVEESFEFGIQCDISSDGSDDVKVNISKYVHYVNL